MSLLTPRSPYRGELRDTILDWEDSLPDRDLTLADEASRSDPRRAQGGVGRGGAETQPAATPETSGKRWPTPSLGFASPVTMAAPVY